MNGAGRIFGVSDSFGLLPPPLARVFLGGAVQVEASPDSCELPSVEVSK